MRLFRPLRSTAVSQETIGGVGWAMGAGPPVDMGGSGLELMIGEEPEVAG